MKLYALCVVESNDSYWITCAYSHDTKKLTTVVRGAKGWFLGKSDITNNPYEVMYTDKDVFPQYSIEEVPFII